MKDKIPKQKMEEFKDKMESFKYLRQNRVNHFQGIYISLLVVAAVLLADIFAGADIILKLLIIAGLVIIAETYYKMMLKQTQKPIFVSENSIGTIERWPYHVKAEDGKEYSIFSLSNFRVKDKKKNVKKRCEL